jgi:hypothetical protein
MPASASRGDVGDVGGLGGGTAPRPATALVGAFDGCESGIMPGTPSEIGIPAPRAAGARGIGVLGGPTSCCNTDPPIGTPDAGVRRMPSTAPRVTHT